MSLTDIVCVRDCSMEDMRGKASRTYVLQESDPSVTALHVACRKGQHEIVAGVLASKEMDVNAQDAHGFTPLHVAAVHGDLNMCSLLLQHGAYASVCTSDGLVASHF
eukprot:402394-Hanusia_phi.AAC.1